MLGILYIVGTPIGNLGDMTLRQKEVLEKVDFIAAEDTRVTLKLLNHLDIKKPLVSYYEHNKRERGGEIISRLEGGESCAVVSDAGMPCISDPGEDLVRLCAECGIETIVVPGPSAAIAALCVSGLSTSRFCFEGFLSTSKKSRREHLDNLKKESRTIIFYEAPHKLLSTLHDLREALGDRRIAVVRELTKIHEEVLRCRISEAEAAFLEKPPRGEIVLVIEGASIAEKQEISFDEAVLQAETLAESGMRIADAAKEAAKGTPFKKSEIYAELTRRNAMPLKPEKG